MILVGGERRNQKQEGTMSEETQDRAAKTEEQGTATDQFGAVSEKKLNANRENAKKSTGPKTPRGKSYSRCNALKHGLFARPSTEFVIMGEDRARYKKLLEDLFEQHQPVGRAEELEVERILVCWWRLQRAWRYDNCANQVSFYGDRKKITEASTACEAKDQAVLLEMEEMIGQAAIAEEAPRGLKQQFLARFPDSEETWRLCEGKTRNAMKAKGLITDAAPHLHDETLAIYTCQRVIDVERKTRKRRIQRWREIRLGEYLIPPRDVLDKIVRSESMNERNRTRALDRLERLQRRRKEEAVLLQTPQKADTTAVPAPKKPPQSDRGLVAGQADSDVADQAAGGSAVAKPAPVACEQSVNGPPRCSESL
jgi:hypothetical protein